MKLINTKDYNKKNIKLSAYKQLLLIKIQEKKTFTNLANFI